MAPIPPKRNRPEKQFNVKCMKCGSKNVMQNLDVKPNNGGERPNLQIEVMTSKKVLGGILGRKIAKKWIFANLCADCGFIEWRVPVTDAKELWEIHQKSQ